MSWSPIPDAKTQGLAIGPPRHSNEGPGPAIHFNVHVCVGYRRNFVLEWKKYIHFVGNYYPFIAIFNMISRDMMYVCTASGNDNQFIQRAIKERRGKKFPRMETALCHFKGSMSRTATPFNYSSTIIN